MLCDVIKLVVPKHREWLAPAEAQGVHAGVVKCEAGELKYERRVDHSEWSIKWWMYQV